MNHSKQTENRAKTAALAMARAEADERGYPAPASLDSLDPSGQAHYMRFAKAVLVAIGDEPLRKLCLEASQVMRTHKVTGSSDAKTGLTTVERLEEAVTGASARRLHAKDKMNPAL